MEKLLHRFFLQDDFLNYSILLITSLGTSKDLTSPTAIFKATFVITPLEVM